MSTRTIQGRGEYMRYEALTDGVVKPGFIVEFTSAGKVKAHSVAGGIAEKAVAYEDALQGNPIGTDYADGVKCQYNIQKSGNIVWVRVADGVSIAKGDKLVSNGDGYVKGFTADSSAVILEEYCLGIALEALDMSDSSAADPTSDLIQMRVL